MRTFQLLITLLLLLVATAALAGGPYHFVVAKDGSGDFRTVQDALNAVPDMRKVETVILVKKGVYKEKIVLAGSKNFVRLVGESLDSTILTFDDYAQKKNRFGEEVGTSGSSSFYLYGNSFTAENLTFANSAGPVGQAVAMLVVGDRAKFVRCRFLGFQDTLYTWGPDSRQYYLDCYIEGTVDFIFGSSTAVFENCTIFGKTAGYFTAASTPQARPFGYVFFNCRFTGNAPESSFYLGRPWRPYAKTVMINCTMDKLVKTAGWHNWEKPDAEKTTFYGEYGSKGPGAATKLRVSWAHLLSIEEARGYTLPAILGDWNPNEAAPASAVAK